MILYIFLVFSLLKVRSAIHALMVMLSLYINTAIFLMSLGLDIFAFLFLIIYAGAITVLFLMVIMMLNLTSLEKENKEQIFYPLSFFAIFFVFLVVFFIISNKYNILEDFNRIFLPIKIFLPRPAPR